MSTKLFLTGATGYIGGTAHAHIARAHPDWEITLLVRNEERAKPIKDAYPKTKFVYGSLSDKEVVEQAAADADIVVHTADSSDNQEGAHNIGRGIARGHTAEKPGYWIHISGTNILTWYDHEHKRHGEAPLPEQAYNDLEGVDKLVNLPDHADHRVVDKIFQQHLQPSVKGAIVCPPTIYGKGAGVVNTRSIQIPDMAKGTLEKGFAPIVGEGKTEWDHIHVDDLANLILLLAEASRDPEKAKSPEIFGINAYYLVEDGAHRWADVATWIAEEASKQGYLPEPLTKRVSQEEVALMDGVSTASYGENSKGKAERAKKYLGWSAKGAPIKDTIADIVAAEAKAQGLTPKEKKG